MNLVEFYQGFFPIVWLAWVIGWWVFALNVKATVRRQAVLPRPKPITSWSRVAPTAWSAIPSIRV